MKTKRSVSSPKDEATVIAYTNPGDALKQIGGADNDNWNGRLLERVVAAIPGGTETTQRPDIIQSVLAGQFAIGPDDPVEAMLAGQTIVANEASLAMYRRAWMPDQTYEARMKYLALADKAARTVAILTEALDRHRGRGQQQIVVRHVTVNADQALVAQQVVTGSRALAGGGGEHHSGNQPHAIGNAQGASLLSDLEEIKDTMPRACR